MALVFCPNCNGILSDLAIKCPHCNLKRDVLFPKNSINVFEIDVNTKLTHKTLGNCIVTQIEDKSFSARFIDGVERKFLIVSAIDYFKNLYMVNPYKEPVVEAKNTVPSYMYNEFDYSTEEPDYDPYYDMETDSGPDEGMGSYEYYYGDDEVVTADELF